MKKKKDYFLKKRIWDISEILLSLSVVPQSCPNA